MSYPDDFTKFLTNCFGSGSDNYNIIYSDYVRKEYGIHSLYKKIDKEIIENDVELLLIEISSPIYDPFIIFDLIKKHALKVVLLAIDDEFKFDWISSSYATIADLVLTSDYVSVRTYQQTGGTVDISGQQFCGFKIIGA